MNDKKNDTRQKEKGNRIMDGYKNKKNKKMYSARILECFSSFYFIDANCNGYIGSLFNTMAK